jgi:chromosome segregation ATPase
MAMDERLEKLTAGLESLKERHEALTQSVELMAAENRERDRRMTEIMEAIARLVHVAEIHEHRIERLEDRP